jgi:hypothetical protein
MAGKEDSITELNKNICMFIKKKYFDPFKIDGIEVTQNKYAEACDLSSSTISKIGNPEGYNIPLSTIYAITQFQKIELDMFFKEFLIQFTNHKVDITNA